jgi:hypothetical protein
MNVSHLIDSYVSELRREAAAAGRVRRVASAAEVAADEAPDRPAGN